jgi:hypothetical protein
VYVADQWAGIPELFSFGDAAPGWDRPTIIKYSLVFFSSLVDFLDGWSLISSHHSCGCRKQAHE